MFWNRFARDRKRRSRSYYRESRTDGKGGSFSMRWNEVRRYADFRPTDRVLDIGCAEGLITLEIAGLVHGVEGIDQEEVRIRHASRDAEERGIRNVRFSCRSVADHPLPPDSYDVILFMGVLHKVDKRTGRRVDFEHLGEILKATRRQLITRCNVQSPAKRARLETIFRLADENGFDVICHLKKAGDQGNLIVMNKRGVDTPARELPEIALVPARLWYGSG